MNIDAAREKECPLMAASSRVDLDSERSRLCIADGCMMWRWTRYVEVSRSEYRWDGEGEDGYCGLAGRQPLSIELG